MILTYFPSFDDGIPASTMREIGVLIELNQFNHPNIVGYILRVSFNA